MSDATTTVSELRGLVARFVAERDWQKYHDAKNLSMSIAIEAAELMEHFQWLRSDELDALLRDGAQRAAVADELADVLCFALALANVLELDVATAVGQKMTKNAAKYPAESNCGTYRKPR
jgi:NTP pyrophosphatase (non-canonical NTP hydrolase)